MKTAVNHEKIHFKRFKSEYLLVGKNGWNILELQFLKSYGSYVNLNTILKSFKVLSLGLVFRIAFFGPWR